MTGKHALIHLTCIGALVAPAYSEQVIFSEINYNPADGKPEFIEVTNSTATPFDIVHWRMTQGVDYTFPDFDESNPRAAFLKQFETILLTGVSEAEFREAYPTTPEDVRIFGPWSGMLNNGGERVTLEDKNGVVMATMRFDDEGRFPVSADGAGHTLTVVSQSRAIDDYRNWKASGARHGTPGIQGGEATGSDIPLGSAEENLETIPYVDFGSVWKLDDSNTDNGTAWTAVDYDDAAWKSGAGLLGFESSPLPDPGIQTALNRDSAGGLVTYYFRAEFNFALGVEGSQIVIDEILDDGAVYYLNGVEIGRTNMAAGEISHDTAASGGVSNAELRTEIIKIDGTGLLRPGKNVFAVSAHNERAGSSDMVFGARLSIAASSPSVILNEVLASGPGEGFIEFYNPLQEEVSLAGHYLSDDFGNLKKTTIGEVNVPAGGLATVGYTESGFTAGEQISVFLTAPDGETILNAVDASIPSGSSWGRKPNGSNNLFILSAPSPGRINASFDDLAELISINEIHFNDKGAIDWVEIRNGAPSAVDGEGLFVASMPDLSDRVPLQGAIASNGRLVVDTQLADATGARVTVFLITGSGVVLDAAKVAVPDAMSSYQASPEGSGEFHLTGSDTKGLANAVEISPIVINEIMYDLPSDHRRGEYVELFNNGDSTVDLTDWSFSEGINFRFPTGATIEAGQYVVVAADVDWFKSVYPNVKVFGSFTGQLADSGELLRLENATGGLVDQVHYFQEGDWPELSDGDGSSLELKHPDMDNSLGTAWADSDETGKATKKSFTITGEYARTNANSGDQELHFHLVGDAYMILENISVTKNGENANLVENVDKESSGSNSSQGWVSQGTHWASFVENGKLHLISDGHGDNKSNRSEIDIERVQRGDELTIKFDATWVNGKPRLIVQTWNHSVGAPVLVPVPDNLGTPGVVNSRSVSDPAPVLTGLLHSPPVPKSDQPVVVTAEVLSPGELDKVELVYRLDNRNGDNEWKRVSMGDSGQAGDDVAGDGVFSARAPEYRDEEDIIQFYVEATTTAGQVTTLPRKGEELPALWVVDDDDVTSDLHLQRFIVSARDLDALGSGGSGSRFNSKFPRMSNHFFNMTFILNEKEIYYNGQIRKSGSPFTRESGSSLTHGKWRLPGDRLLRGRRKTVIDPSTNYNDRIARYFLYLMGHPINEFEWVQVMINDGRPRTSEDMEPIATDFIKRNFEDGNKGTLLRIDDEWFFGDGGSGGSRNADWGYKDSDNPIRYQSEWLMRSQETRYDYTSFVEFVKTLDENDFTIEQIDRIMDRDLNCINAAVRGYDADWDTLTLNRGKNGYFYRKPDGPLDAGALGR